MLEVVAPFARFNLSGQDQQRPDVSQAFGAVEAGESKPRTCLHALGPWRDDSPQGALPQRVRNTHPRQHCGRELVDQLVAGHRMLSLAGMGR